MSDFYEIVKDISPHLGYFFAILYIAKKAKELLVIEFKKVIDANDRGVDKQIEALEKQQKEISEKLIGFINIGEMHVEELKYVHEKVDQHEDKIKDIDKHIKIHDKKIARLENE